MNTTQKSATWTEYYDRNKTSWADFHDKFKDPPYLKDYTKPAAPVVVKVATTPVVKAKGEPSLPVALLVVGAAVVLPLVFLAVVANAAVGGSVFAILIMCFIGMRAV